MLKKTLLSFWVVLISICGFFPACVLADNTDLATFAKHHLTVTPPDGWISEQNDSGMFKSCVAYAPQDKSVILAACPGFEKNMPFKQFQADFERNERGVRIDRCVLLRESQGGMLLAPLKQGKEGALFIITPNVPTEEDFLHKVEPVLRQFGDFDISEALFSSKK